MIKKIAYRFTAVFMVLALFSSVWCSCKNPAADPAKPQQPSEKEKGHNAGSTGITVFGKPVIQNGQDIFIEVPEDETEENILKSIKILFEDSKAYFEIEKDGKEFKKERYAEKIYKIRTFAEDKTPGKVFTLKLIRLDIDKMIQVTPPEGAFNSGLGFRQYPRHYVLNNDRKIALDPYAIGKYEVPYALWKRVCDWAVSRKENKYTFTSAGKHQEESVYTPVTDILWSDAVVWCNAYSEYKAEFENSGYEPLYVKSGSLEVLRSAADENAVLNAEIRTNVTGCRLPTEVEWEAAARGGNWESDDWAFDYAGTKNTNELQDFAWFQENSNGKTHKIGTKKPNLLGLYDTMGNVYEFCFDFVEISEAFKAGVEVTNPCGFRNTSLPVRAQRGGSFASESAKMKLAVRHRVNTTVEDAQNGFRIVTAKAMRPFTKETPAEKEVLDITEIKAGSQTFTKETNLASLNGKEIEVPASETSLQISVKAKSIGSSARLYVNDEPVLGVPFENGTANYTLSITGTAAVKLQITDLGKKNSVYNFTVKVQGSSQPPSPLPPPPPPPLSTIDVTEIKVGDKVFSKGANLTSLEGSTVTVGSSPAEISIKASNVSETAGIKINGQALVHFIGGTAKQNINISGLTNVKLEIFDTAKTTAVYNFKVKVQESEPQISNIKVVSYGSIPVEFNGADTYSIKLKTGAEYQIKTEITPANAQDKKLLYSVDAYDKEFITVSETGLLTVIKKRLRYYYPSSVTIESSNGVTITLKIDIDNDAGTMIKDWALTGTGVDMSGDNNRINIPGKEQSKAVLRITKRSKHIVYKYPNDNKNIIITPKNNADDTVDEYEITINPNKTVWKKSLSIPFYIEEYKRNKLERINLKTIYITQEANFDFEKEIKWVEGVDAPADNALKNTKPYSYASWIEDSTTKWFGVRKRSYIDNDYEDSKMCWAMTAANMLHWWFTQNETEIKQYMQKKGITFEEGNGNFYKNDYKRGEINKEADKSSFASLLRVSFHNDGSQVNTALGWYLEGKEVRGGIQKNPPKTLFGEVMNSGKPIINMASLNNKRDINELFTKAVNEKKAIAVSYESTLYPIGHVVTVWGISLDGDGNVFELWVADSDASNGKIPYLYNMGIHYDDKGMPKVVNLSNTAPAITNHKFSYITTLDLGKEKFQRFFSNSSH